MKELYKLNLGESKKPIAVFGTGIHAKETFFELLNQGIKPTCFVDRNQNLSGLKMYGIPVIREEELEGFDCVIIIASRAWEDIERRLKKMGKEDIFVDKKRYWRNIVEL